MGEVEEIVAPPPQIMRFWATIFYIIFLHSRLKMQFQKKLCCKFFKVIKVVNFDADVLFFQIEL